MNNKYLYNANKQLDKQLDQIERLKSIDESISMCLATLKNLQDKFDFVSSQLMIDLNNKNDILNGK